jgi:formylglycine-generating enzyme required for sulfatase activity
MGWWITPSGMDMRVITRPDGTRFAISAREVTEGEYKRFERVKHYGGNMAEGKNLPVSSRTWVNAAHYALWLSEQEKLPNEEMCYEVDGNNVLPHPKAISRSGFRMPTMQEWLMAANSAPSTFWDFGNALSCLTNYGWVAVNAGDNPRPVGTLLPNEQGLWDTIGNVSELTHELINTRNTSSCHLMGRDCMSPKSMLLDPTALQVGQTAIGLQTGFRLARELPPMETH